jgi:hypothetical protein
MKISYLYASAAGDKPLAPAALAAPFLLAPNRPHPFLTLGDYCRAIAHYLRADDGRHLGIALHELLPGYIGFQQIRRLDICSEKHGELYHICRVTLHDESQRIVTLAITAALTDTGRAYLTREFELLNLFQQADTASLLPRVFSLGHLPWRTGDNTLDISLMVGEWFTGYHEWHIEPDTTDGTQKIRLWDTVGGHRYLTATEAFGVIQQAATILTRCYDPASGRQLWPWHHAAGDFIVYGDETRLMVKLISARSFLPIFTFADGKVDAVTCLVGFFLLMSLRLRLDREKGVGQIIWLDDFAVHAAIAGFLSGLQGHEAAGRLETGFVDDFLAILRSFTADDLRQLTQPLLVYLDDEADLATVHKQLPSHCRVLQDALAAVNKDQE